MTLPQDLSTRFQVQREIGSGPTGTSYQVKDSQTGRDGLLKVLEAGSSVPAAERQRIKRELAKQAKIASARLASLYECSSAEPLWLFREYVAGETLDQRIARGPLPLSAALSITAQMATALDELHRAGLLHRDLKPAHVVLGPGADTGDGVSVIDAGIAARIETGAVFDVIGTAAYVSPEQVMGKLVSFRSDLYALGCVLFEMLTGRPPYEADSAKAVLEAHKSSPVPALDVTAPPEVVTLLNSLLAKEPRSRPFSAQQVRRALEPFLPGSTTSVARPGSLPPPPAGQPLRTSPGLPAPVQPKKAPAEDDGVEELSADELEAIEPTVLSATPFSPPEEDGEGLDLLEDADDSAPPPAAPPTATTAQATAPDHSAIQTGPHDLEMIPDDAEEATDGSGDSDAPPSADDDVSDEAPPVAAQRAAEAFDVESLFEDDDPPAAPSDTDVTRVFRPLPGNAAAAVLEKRPGAEDPDRTVVMRNPLAAHGPDKRILGGAAAAAVALLLGWMFFSGDDAEDAPAAATVEASADSDSTPKASAPSERPSAAARPSAPTPEEETSAPEAEANAVEEPAEAPAVAKKPALDEEPTAETAPARPSRTDSTQRVATEPSRPAATSAKADRPAPRTQPAPAAASGQSVEELRKLARAEFQARRYAEAARYYQQAASKSPSDAGTFAGLGAALLASGDARAAITAYQRAIQISPKQSGFRAALGRAYFQLGDTARAVASYRAAVELDPNNGVAKAALDRLED